LTDRQLVALSTDATKALGAKNFKLDARLSILPDAATVIALLSAWFETTMKFTRNARHSYGLAFVLSRLYLSQRSAGTRKLL
jgi:hypothetical protein